MNTLFLKIHLHKGLSIFSSFSQGYKTLFFLIPLPLSEHITSVKVYAIKETHSLHKIPSLLSFFVKSQNFHHFLWNAMTSLGQQEPWFHFIINLSSFVCLLSQLIYKCSTLWTHGVPLKEILIHSPEPIWGSFRFFGFPCNLWPPEVTIPPRAIKCYCKNMALSHSVHCHSCLSNLSFK